ncbi:jg6606 [Pararge aegeria aegeria]|uniref:Jg6606 protein n=1 Tax=Pararge aegeria aegeria TaxID=348720 RepID=A0A8S4RY74_9NEOP|nr:jg6606 [Pararge aegeria aegeria]
MSITVYKCDQYFMENWHKCVIAYTLHGQLMRTIGAAVLALAALSSAVTLSLLRGRTTRDMHTKKVTAEDRTRSPEREDEVFPTRLSQLITQIYFHPQFLQSSRDRSGAPAKLDY